MQRFFPALTSARRRRTRRLLELPQVPVAHELLNRVNVNGLLLGGLAAATATAIVARDVFPLRFTRVLTRGVLDSLLIIGRRPPPGTAVDVSALTSVELTDPVRTSGVAHPPAHDPV